MDELRVEGPGFSNAESGPIPKKEPYDFDADRVKDEDERIYEETLARYSAQRRLRSASSFELLAVLAVASIVISPKFLIIQKEANATVALISIFLSGPNGDRAGIFVVYGVFHPYS